MSRRRGYGVLLALAATLWTACGRGESGAAAQSRAVAASTPGAPCDDDGAARPLACGIDA